LGIDQAAVLTDNSAQYLRTFVNVLHTRWFGTATVTTDSNECNHMRAMILVSIDGTEPATHSVFTRSTFIRVTTGLTCMHFVNIPLTHTHTHTHIFA
jgi:hypothetical protein